MKIALVTPFYFPTVGGYSTFAHNLAKALTSLGHSVDIITPRINGQDIKNLSDNLRVVFLTRGCISIRKKFEIIRNLDFKNFCLLYANDNFYVKVAHWLLEQRYDVVHTNGFPFEALPSIFQKDSISVHTFHTQPWKPAKLPSRFLYQRLLKFIDHTTCVSQHLASNIFSKLGVRSDNIISNGVDLDFFRPELKSEANELVVGSVTNFNIKDKALGLKMLIDAVKILEIEDLYPSIFKLVIVGTGKFRKEIMEYADNVGLTGVVFKIATYDEMPSIYNEFDIYVHASGLEGFALTFLEAMACGKPVVANANFAELVSTKAVHIAKSPYAMAEALRILITDAEKRKDRGSLAREEANIYSWENIAKCYLRLYNTR